MSYTLKDLKGKTAAQLKEIAGGIEHEAVKGFTQMNKDHLLPALCTALGVDAHAHHEAVGIDKSTLKAKLRQLKAERDAAVEAGDHARLKALRRQRHAINRQIRQHLI